LGFKKGELKMAKNILVVDDEGLVTKSLKKLLAKEGFNAIVAKDAKEAIEQFKSQKIDLIVSDVKMPEMDGIQAIEKMRQLQKEAGRKPIPEILITGYADEEKYKNALKLGIKDYIFKPFDTGQLLETIERNLNATDRPIC
jgi:CheY-like chemotaxis protein